MERENLLGIKVGFNNEEPLQTRYLPKGFE